MLDFPRWKQWLVLVIIAAAIVAALPNFVPAMRDAAIPGVPNRTMSLGLDLQGGSYLLLEIDSDAYIKEQMENTVADVRKALRDQDVGYRGLKATEREVRFDLRNPQDADKVQASLQSLDDRLTLSQDGSRYRLSFTDDALREVKLQLLEQSIEIVRRRVDETGTREPIIQRQGQTRILLQVPGLKDPERLKELLGKTARLSFHMVDMTVNAESALRAGPPPGRRVLPLEDGRGRDHIVIERRAMLGGDLLTQANATFEQGQPAVSFRFNTIGARKFGEITTQNVGKPFAIVLDQKVISAPVIREPIPGGSGIISGNFTVETANDLALLLRAGALPAPLEVIEERSVGPSLGADSIEAGKKAVILGFVLVMIFMALVYGRFGLYANLALILNVILVVAALSLFQATLTLPGIAGIVLTMGMAVDANVLIFERIYEEARNGKTPFAAVDNGFRLAFRTILDSNLTTLIAAAILFYMGSGAIKGFAVTLSIGILASMFSAILFTRMLVVGWVKRVRPATLEA